MSPSNMISVMVAACFVVFIGLGNTSLFYYAAKVRDSFQATTGVWKRPNCVPLGSILSGNGPTQPFWDLNLAECFSEALASQVDIK